jgi:hypothetical protein
MSMNNVRNLVISENVIKLLNIVFMAMCKLHGHVLENDILYTYSVGCIMGSLLPKQYHYMTHTLVD